MLAYLLTLTLLLAPFASADQVWAVESGSIQLFDTDTGNYVSSPISFKPGIFIGPDVCASIQDLGIIYCISSNDTFPPSGPSEVVTVHVEGSEIVSISYSIYSMNASIWTLFYDTTAQRLLGLCSDCSDDGFQVIDIDPIKGVFKPAFTVSLGQYETYGYSYGSSIGSGILSLSLLGNNTIPLVVQYSLDTNSLAYGCFGEFSYPAFTSANSDMNYVCGTVGNFFLYHFSSKSSFDPNNWTNCSFNELKKLPFASEFLPPTLGMDDTKASFGVQLSDGSNRLLTIDTQGNILANVSSNLVGTNLMYLH